MKIILIIYFIFIQTLISEAKELTIAVSLPLPPYIMTDDSGFEIEVMKQALEYKKHSVKFLHDVPILRFQDLLSTRQIDGARRGNINLKEGIDVFYGNIFLKNSNCAFFLKSSNIELSNLKSLAQLTDKTIMSFQGASKILGKEFENITQNLSKYTETANQVNQVEMMYLNRLDILIIDANVFNYISSQIKDRININQELVKQDFLGAYDIPVFKNPAFIDKQIRDDFNEGLEYLKSSGIYQELIKKYNIIQNENLTQDKITI